VAFVSTNSIAQGEQTGILWNELFGKYKIKIHFAHRTFSWSNEAKGNAAVHVVIIGFACFDTKEKWIYKYDDNIKGEPTIIKARNINPYLIDANDQLLKSRFNPICDVPKIGIGNKPIDGGHYLFEKNEMEDFISKEPLSKQYFHPWYGSKEFLQNYKRWVLWLGDINPSALKGLPKCLERVDLVRKYRLNSSSPPTRKLAQTPTRFHVENFPKTSYLLIPKVSSERREYIPFGFMSPYEFSSDLVFIANEATLFHFGILTSRIHMSWVKHTCGRLESRFRYSKDIVYNNYPWPKDPSEKNRKKVEEKAQAVLDARAQFPDSSLADLYDPLTMPPALVKAHNELDKAVDLCYRPQPFPTETSRIEYLFDLYGEYTSPIFHEKKGKK
jgi:hypothetical protein